ncbi:Dimethylmenaquinone methyltransferase [Thermus sp. CCB_US3_UF1]|uniref:4-carboxy-4-hydroxy-2-oxoadipate aldolase/oxaloacetate decarboxylase n=1 Tax=unclassified Thermus TaxID=2619321 RepID=UPI00023895BE|nr:MULTISPECIES: 4-carboxy-4-hydroxy-2-oxoadipate aldolase/oxaloacetate decarboxylase [unclassified Thermus]AEV16333.1 Dimethylmenaquinone methyltransferase [Thermus sp. CCB_US3_UF1]MCS6867692.1 4-carboxy-4-hydroxy-2-oxoadipate aldolase/oxaloacetate decarboxylase [Thermus sp.]MCX7849483.1 4-carboxy-4-hydroxy-2-oxoadipate aldolase/oxaloacetate decarboxylase [Thermus sp.]MDW8017525.1 4-carboxy-4-hydroxy-2-oxoadipate aldolase/oxaloacetate decarboxylase [Thermus sp.]MDW8357784.1 4-carboxy-4-hydrox
MLSPEEVRELAALGSATLYEASGREGLVQAGFLRIPEGAKAAGPALPVLCAQGDNLGAHAAMAALRPGEVLVLGMPEPEPVALVGELLATQAKAQGAAALLVDGAVRDRDELVSLGLPVWARWVSPRGARRERVLGLGVPVRVGGVEVRLGDYLVLDGDGVVVVRRERAREVLQRARERAGREAALRERFARGELSLDLYGLREGLKEALAQVERAREAGDG